MDIPALIVTGLVTLIGSGVGTAVVNYWLAERKAERDLRRTKLEELFLAFVSWTQTATSIWISQYAVLTRPNSEVSIPKTEDPRESGARKLELAEMLITLHFPELKGSFEAILECRQEIGDLLFVRMDKSKPSFDKEMEKFRIAEKALKHRIAWLMAELRNRKPKA